VVDFAGAYPVPSLLQAQRRMTVDHTRNTIRVEDRFEFTDPGHSVDDVFVTWLPVTTDGGTAVIHGRRHRLRLQIESPSQASFALESMVDDSRANEKVLVLQRLSVGIEGGTTMHLRLRIEVTPIDAAAHLSAPPL
jgi:hypothetical protein